MNYLHRKYTGGLLKAGLCWGMLALMICLLPSCDKGFAKMNINPNSYNTPVIGSLFSYNLVKTAGSDDDNTLYPNDKLAGAMMQYFASLNPYQWTGDKYLPKTGYSDGLFNAVFNVELKENAQILALTKDQPDLINEYAIAEIWHVYIMHRVTDMYGDVPYSEAGQGYTQGIYKPKYDKQSDIYPSMLQTLADATTALDPSKSSFGAADYLYGGDPGQWKKFAFSLMLRLGMRLTNVDPASAQTWVQKAIAGGVMTSNDDIAKLDHTDGTDLNFYWDGEELRGGEGVPPSAKGLGYGKMGKTFVDYLKNTSDPRLPFYITLWQGNADPSQLPTSTLPASQVGLPNGYDYSSISTAIPGWNDNSLAQISEINLNTIASNSTPSIFMHYSEVEFLLAEAALRGWGPGDDKTHYENAVRASMEEETLFPGGSSVSAPAIAAYLTANPFVQGSFDNDMKQIHTQYWASLFMNNMEVYANWRRTGYPVLVPVNYPGNATGGTIPRRLPYPQSEASLNTDNYKAAVASQGADLFTTRVWWDKQP